MALRVLKMSEITRLGLGICGVVALAATGCGSSAATAKDSGVDTGPDTGAGTDGSTAMDATGDLFPAACIPAVAQNAGANYVVTDFTYVDGNPTDGTSWGYTSPDAFSGFTYSYPSGLIVSDVATGAWHITGMVSDYSGLGMGFTCQDDFSAFTGLSFTIKGNAGISGHLTLSVSTAADDVNAETGAASLGRCVPKTSQYDGTCAAPKFTVPVTAAGSTVKVTWAQLTGGKPQASVNPKELSTLVWTFDWTPFLTTAYAVDLTIDDVVFTIN